MPLYVVMTNLPGPGATALLDAVPRPDPERERKPVLAGEIPSILHPPPGCTFSARCPLAIERCRIDLVELFAVGCRDAKPVHLGANGGC